MKIRHAQWSDLPRIVDIYNQAIQSQFATGDLSEFTVKERQDWFLKFDKDNYPIYVAELDSKIVGYCTLSPYRPGREAMARVAEISYYVDFALHQKGIGSALIHHALSDCKRIGKNTLLAILLDINTPSIKILEKFGFKRWGHFPDIIQLKGKSCGHLVYGLKVNHL